MSITFLALYFAPRSTAVNSTSRAGLEIAKLAARWAAWKAMTTHRPGASHSARKPAQKTAGRKAAAGPGPKRAISRPVAANCTSMVRVPIARSIEDTTRLHTARDTETRPQHEKPTHDRPHD